MRILIVNDDGIDAPGLNILEQIAANLSDDIFVVAPSENKSAVGHHIALNDRMQAKTHGHQRFSLTAYPADCVAFAHSHLLQDKAPDLILSGVNRGMNAGDLVYGSGTVAAAREGALRRIPSIALSQHVNYVKPDDDDWSSALEFGAQLITRCLDDYQSTADADIFYNINFPHCGSGKIQGVKAAPLMRFPQSPFNIFPLNQSDDDDVVLQDGFAYSLDLFNNPYVPGSDVDLIKQNYITLTPVEIRASHEAGLKRLENIALKNN